MTSNAHITTDRVRPPKCVCVSGGGGRNMTLWSTSTKVRSLFCWNVFWTSNSHGPEACQITSGTHEHRLVCFSSLYIVCFCFNSFYILILRPGEYPGEPSQFLFLRPMCEPSYWSANSNTRLHVIAGVLANHPSFHDYCYILTTFCKLHVFCGHPGEPTGAGKRH